jgi:hypothetical protein
VRSNHWKAVTEDHDDRRVDTRDGRRQDHMVWNFHFVAIKIVVPMNAVQVARVCSILVDASGAACGDAVRLSQLTKGGENNLLLSESANTVFQ